MKEYNLILDMYDGLQDARMIEFNQVNTGTCKLDFTLKNNKVAYDLTDKKVTLTVKTPSGSYIEDSILVTDANDGKCEIVLANDMIGEKGMHIAEVSIYSLDMVKLQTSKVFRYYIGTNLGEEGIKVDTRYSTLQDLIFDVDAIKQEAVIDLDRVNQLEVEAARINTESKAINTVTESVNAESKAINSETARVNEESKLILTDVTAKSLQVEADAKRTEDNSSQVSNDKGVVTRYKNETLQHKNDAESAKTQSQQLKTDVEGLASSTITDITTTGNTQVSRVTTEGTKQVELAKIQAVIATQQADRSKTEADRAQALTAEIGDVSSRFIAVENKNNEQDNRIKVLEEEPSSNVTLNGLEQSNFNFIGNQVVQDGLVHAKNYNGEKQTILGKKEFPLASEVFTIVQEFIVNGTAPTNTNYNILCEFSTVPIYITIDKSGAFSNSNFVKNKIYSMNTPLNLIGKNYFSFTLNKTSGIFYLYVNGVLNSIGEVLDSTKFGLYKPLFSSLTESTYMYSNRELYTVQIYNRPLTPTEITHNFSVLNSSPSISQLQVTNLTNQTSILSLGSTGDHVEMSSGRTLEEEYVGVLEGMSQEYTSNGEPITINNGLKARLVGAEITGNTKRLDADGNECEAGTEGARLVSTEACISNNEIKYPFYQQYINGETVVQKRAKGSSNEWVTIPVGEVRDTVANEYRLYSPIDGLGSVGSVIDNVDLASKKKIDNTKEVILNGSEVWVEYDNANKDVLCFSCLTSDKAIGDKKSICDIFSNSSDSWLNRQDMTFADHYTTSVWYFCIAKSKLSTQGVNGFKAWLAQNPVTVRYQLTTPTTTQLTDEQFATYLPYKEQISLRGVDRIANKFTFNNDGSSTIVESLKKDTLKEHVSWYNPPPKNNDSTMLFQVALEDAKQNGYIISDMFETKDIYENTNVTEGIYIHSSSNVMIVRILRSKLTRQDVYGFKLWLRANHVTIHYQLATPTTTIIPKEVNTPILTNQSNILSAGEAVAPSSFKVKVPINLASQIQEVKALINSPSNLSIHANYVEDEYNKCINDINQI